MSEAANIVRGQIKQHSNITLVSQQSKINTYRQSKYCRAYTVVFWFGYIRLSILFSAVLGNIPSLFGQQNRYTEADFHCFHKGKITNDACAGRQRHVNVFRGNDAH